MRARCWASTGALLSAIVVDVDAEEHRARASRNTQFAVALAVAHLLLWLLLRGVLGDAGVAVMSALAAAQMVAGVLAGVAGVRLRRVDPGGLFRGVSRSALVVGLLVSVSAPLVWVGGAVSVTMRGLDRIDIPRLSHH